MCTGYFNELEYFKDWQTRVGDTFECEVRWSSQFSNPEVYFSSEKFKQALILGIDNSKIKRILFTPQSFSAVGFSIDETPYNVGFINANVPKKIPPLDNHFFCPNCGRKSEDLNWREGVIFKEGPGWGKQTGMIVFASVCPECNVVCEVSPDRNVKRVLSMTREQQQKADAGSWSLNPLQKRLGRFISYSHHRLSCRYSGMEVILSGILFLMKQPSMI